MAALLISRYQSSLSIIIVSRWDQRAGPGRTSWLLPRLHVPLSPVDRRGFAVMSQAHLDHTPPRKCKDKGPPATFLIAALWKVIKHPSAGTACQRSWRVVGAAFSVFSCHSLASAPAAAAQPLRAQHGAGPEQGLPRGRRGARSDADARGEPRITAPWHRAG